MGHKCIIFVIKINPEERYDEFQFSGSEERICVCSEIKTNKALAIRMSCGENYSKRKKL